MNAIRSRVAPVIICAICLFALGLLRAPAAEAEPEGQGGAFSEQPAEVRMTLSDALNMALANNLDLRLASYDPLILEEGVCRALSEFDPTLRGQFSYTSERSPSFLLFGERLSAAFKRAVRGAAARIRR